MSRTTRLVVLSALLVCLTAIGFGSGSLAMAQTPPPARTEPQLAVTVEVYCSETKLQTSSARIHWGMPKEALAASGMKSFAGAKQSLEATVYRNGFEKGLMVSIPISQASPEHPVAAQGLGQDKKSKVRAFQFSLVGIEQPKEALAAEGGGEMGVALEGLEPGVSYTWRIAIETGSGRIVSATATSQARVCPADMVPAGAAPEKKP